MVYAYEMYKAYVGPWIKSLREEMGMTQKQVSDATGFSIQTVSKFENSKVQPDNVSFDAIVHFVVDSFFGNEEPQDPDYYVTAFLYYVKEVAEEQLLQ